MPSGTICIVLYWYGHGSASPCRLSLTANLIPLSHIHSSLTDTMIGFVIRTRWTSFQVQFLCDWHTIKSHTGKTVKLQKLSCALTWGGKKWRGSSTSPGLSVLWSPRPDWLYQESSNPSCIPLWHLLHCYLNLHTGMSCLPNFLSEDLDRGSGAIGLAGQEPYTGFSI